MTTNTTPAATLFATTREPSPLAFLDYAPRIGYGLSFALLIAGVVIGLYAAAKAMRARQIADEKQRDADHAQYRAAFAALEPGRLAQMEALCEAERAIARAQDFAREVTR